MHTPDAQNGTHTHAAHPFRQHARRTYDYLLIARAKVLDQARTLTPEQYLQPFPIGLSTLARTLTHTMICEWYYIQRMLSLPTPPYPQWPIQDEHPPAFPELERAWTEQAERTKAAIDAIADWTVPITYTVVDTHAPAPHPTIEVSATAADIFTQLVLHEVHHRAQAMNILRHLGRKLPDLDYNEFMYHRRTL